MFITWDPGETTSRNLITRTGTVQSRGPGETYHVTATTNRKGGIAAKVTLKRGSKVVVREHVVNASRLNGDVLALVRKVESGDNADHAPLTDPGPEFDRGLVRVGGDLVSKEMLDDIGDDTDPED